MKNEPTPFQNDLLDKVGTTIRQTIEQHDAPQTLETIQEIAEVLGALSGIFSDISGCPIDTIVPAFEDGFKRAITALNRSVPITISFDKN